MKIETNPGYGNYNCEFIAHIQQGTSSPVTVVATRSRSREDDVEVVLKVGQVEIAKFRASRSEDMPALAELFNRANYYQFVPEAKEE